MDSEEGKGRGGEGLKQRVVYGRRECGGQARKGRAVCAGDRGGGAGRLGILTSPPAFPPSRSFCRQSRTFSIYSSPKRSRKTS